MLKITDPCYGDSGGPLAIWRAGHWQLVGVLEVFLYFFFADFFLKGRGIQLRDKRDEWRWKLEQCGHSEGNWLRLPKIAHWLPIDCPLIDQLNLFIICRSKGLDSRPAWAGTPDRWIHISANFETDFNVLILFNNIRSIYILTISRLFNEISEEIRLVGGSEDFEGEFAEGNLYFGWEESWSSCHGKLNQSTWIDWWS